MPALGYIPGYNEAVSREALLREAAFLSDWTTIDGLRVMRLTPRHLLLAIQAESPFICGGPLDDAAVLQFLWLVRDPAEWPIDSRQSFIDKHLPRVVIPSLLAILIVSINQYLRDAFMDRPESPSGDTSAPYYATITGLIDTIAHEYHWDDEAIMDKSFQRLFQYLRRITERQLAEYGEQAIFCNPSDHILLDSLDEEMKESTEEPEEDTDVTP